MESKFVSSKFHLQQVNPNKGKTNLWSRIRIICNETQEEYKSLTEAAQKIGVPLSRLSKHLSGIDGYESIIGKTFKKVKT